MMTEWDEAARNLTARGARGMSEQTLSSLQATRVELGLEPVQMPSEDLELAGGWEVVVNEPATDEWAGQPTAEQEEASTRHTTVEVSQEESDALWASVPQPVDRWEAAEASGIRFDDEPHATALDEWAELVPKAEERTAEAKASGGTWEDGNRGNGWTWHAQGGWRHAPKAEDRTAEEVAAKERQLARTRELREEDDGTCDY